MDALGSRVDTNDVGIAIAHEQPIRRRVNDCLKFKGQGLEIEHAAIPLGSRRSRRQKTKCQGSGRRLHRTEQSQVWGTRATKYC